MNPLIPGVSDHRERILIVDDDLHNRELLGVTLAPEGFLLRAATTGEEAMAIIAAQPPDLILLDVMMPEMDGYEVARRVKSDFATKNIPIIMITARDDRDARMRGLEAGAEDFLTKPVDRAELSVRVRNLLRLKAYGDYHDKYSQMLQGEVDARTLELHQSDLTLRRERDRAQQYLDTAGVFLVALNSENRITLANRYACSVLGWEQEELLGRDWFTTCVPERLRASLRSRHDEVLAGGTSVGENAVLTKAGEERLMEWRNTLLRDDTGTVIGLLSSGTDITDRVAAIAAVKAEEERTSFALSNARVGIWDIDYATGVCGWSALHEELYGLMPGTFGRTFDAFVGLIHPDDRERTLETIRAAVASGQDFSTQNRTILSDGSVRWLEGTGRIHLDQQGQPVRGIGISIDVTERIALANQAQQSLKMEAVGRLASGVAHDFNNLLTVILGFAEFIGADLDKDSQHGRDVGEIVKAANRATALTQQLLAFSRQQVLHASTLDVNELIIDMTGMLERLIGAEVSMKLALSSECCKALVDRSQLEQVVMNLVVNARDAMPNGGTVLIETAEIELENSVFHEEAVTPGRYAMVSVTDNGSGMSKETQRHLFEPFFTTKEAGKGTGLGLSMIYGVVKQSKGHIWVYSELGHGTTFKVYLPLAGAPDESPAVATAPPLRVDQSGTILLVEDEVSARQLSARILTDAGYDVVEARTGSEAENIFATRGDAIDLVIADVIMPICGGVELVSRLRRQTPELKALFVSGYTARAAATHGGLDMGLPFLQKPFTADALVCRVREALN